MQKMQVEGDFLIMVDPEYRKGNPWGNELRPTKGCIRVSNEDMVDISDKINDLKEKDKNEKPTITQVRHKNWLDNVNTQLGNWWNQLFGPDKDK